MKGLALLDRSNGAHLSGEMVLRLFYGADNLDVKDCNGLTSGNLDTYIASLTDDNYDKVHVMVVADASGGTGKISYQQIGNLIAKLVQANLVSVADGTCDTNSTATNIVLASTASAVDDAYNGMFVVTTGTTAVTRYISDYTGSSKTATVLTTTTAVTTTEEYNVYDVLGEDQIAVHSNTLTGKDVFELVYPNCEVPRFLKEMGEDETLKAATADSVATTSGVSTLTDSGNFTAAAYDNGEYYLGIVSATTGAGQVLRIVSNTANVLTLDGAFDPLPTGTIVYQVVHREWRCLNAYFLKYAMRYFFGNISGYQKDKLFKQLVCGDGDIDQTTFATFQNLKKVEELKAVGKQIMLSLGRGISS